MTESNNVIKWIEYYDESLKKFYYYNMKDKSTRWNKPDASDLTDPSIRIEIVRYNKSNIKIEHNNENNEISIKTNNNINITEESSKTTHEASLTPSSHTYAMSTAPIVLSNITDNENVQKLNKILNNIERNDINKTEINSIKEKSYLLSNRPTSSIISEEKRDENPDIKWKQIYDPHTNMYYYHNIITNTTQWEKPDNNEEFIPSDIKEGIDWLPNNFINEEITNQQNKEEENYKIYGKFNIITKKYEYYENNEYWNSKGQPNDKEGRQMNNFFDLNTLEENRMKAKKIKQKLQNNKNIDWKKINKEKKEKKRKRNNQWLFED